MLIQRTIDLQGWQLDKLAADPKGGQLDDSDSDSDEEDIPWACYICRKPYTDPVRSLCFGSIITS